MLEFLLTDAQGKLTTINEMQQGCWINMLAPTKEEVDKVCKITGVERDFITSALDEEERPRIESEDGHSLIIMDIPIVEPNSAGANSIIFSTMPIGIIVCPECVITVCLKKNQIIKDFLNNRIKTFATYKKNRFILQLMYRNATYYLQYLRQIEKRSHNIENEVYKSMKNKELILLLSLKKSLVYFSTSLKANQIVLEKLMKYNYDNISIRKYPEDEDLLEDVIIENKQAIEMEGIYSNILSDTMDAFASIISNNLNIVMKFLAAMTIVMAIPTMISGFFGMNVPLPLQDITGAFYLICGGTAGICAIVVYILYKKKMF
ncbi:MAG: magnesium transporter CorA family protein [Ruminococcaceae bacterium]|nr:magnesium transporter CorA family protein [Oscillospiraceae bacterium]